MLFSADLPVPPLAQRPGLFMRVFDGLGPPPAQTVFASSHWAEIFSAAEESFALGLLKGVEAEMFFPRQFPKNAELRTILLRRCETFVFSYLGNESALFAEGRIETLQNMARVAAKTANTGFTDALSYLVFGLPFSHLVKEDQRRKGEIRDAVEEHKELHPYAYVWYGSGPELAFWLARTSRNRLLTRDELWEKAAHLFVKPDGTRFKVNTLTSYASKGRFFEDNPISPKDSHIFDELEDLGSGDTG